MNKKKVLLGLLVSGLLLIGPVWGYCDGEEYCCGSDGYYYDEGWYTAAAGSFAWSNDTLLDTGSRVTHNHGGGVSVSLGYRVEAWRLELQGKYLYFGNEHYRDPNGVVYNDGGYFRHVGGFVNLLADIPLRDRLYLYLGGGGGVLNSRLRISAQAAGTAVDEDSVFAWQLMGGLAYEFYQCWYVTVGYTYLRTARPKLKMIGDTKRVKLRKQPYANTVDAGLLLRF